MVGLAIRPSATEDPPIFRFARHHPTANNPAWYRISPAPTRMPRARRDPCREVLPRAPVRRAGRADCPTRRRPGTAALAAGRKTGLPRNRAKGRIVQAKQFGQADRIRIGPRPQGGLGGRRRPTVERANVLADVAAEDPLSDRRPHFGRDRLAEFDRQVGDALPRVEPIGLDDRAVGHPSMQARQVPQ